MSFAAGDPGAASFGDAHLYENSLMTYSEP